MLSFAMLSSFAPVSKTSPILKARKIISTHAYDHQRQGQSIQFRGARPTPVGGEYKIVPDQEKDCSEKIQYASTTIYRPQQNGARQTWVAAVRIKMVECLAAIERRNAQHRNDGNELFLRKR
ncbi:hypothetical protein K493DRAFT_405841 [Basidiobolus meristosporus CBS 931.73]|uniref:Uncharacterized protein n=1 Tax=Basidiobolus meristosporus CBS 931.73 TaxID=1314790 RepID=A0A1Y1YRJ2_9FUNG|nr:hypothetical protein K493DRAFT_405841 [Basidiobolus meristosporus CBS 931.73]|eukprot:ORY00643.1 hypothetical protein K493DRAFT_405841 [Basidiobolus meristosporus CBS 931.73]